MIETRRGNPSIINQLHSFFSTIVARPANMEFLSIFPRVMIFFETVI